MMKKTVFLFTLCGMVFLSGCDLSSNLFHNDSETEEVKQVTEKKSLNLNYEEDDDDEMSVIEYNDVLIDLIEQCSDAEDEFYAILDSDEEIPDDFEDIFENAILACQDSLEQIQDYYSFDGDSSFAESVEAFLETENEILGNYLEYFSLEEDLDEETEDQFWKLMDDLASQSDTLYDQMSTVQEKFAKKHGFDLEE